MRETVTLEIERKFVLEKGDLMKLISDPDSPAQLIVQTYLVNTFNNVERVRKIFSAGSTSYSHTIKKKTNLRYTVIEDEKVISEPDYYELLKRVDVTRTPITKKRYYKYFGNNLFSIDVYIAPNPGKVLVEMEFESIEEAQSFSLPNEITKEFLLTEVSDRQDYSNYSLAKK